VITSLIHVCQARSEPEWVCNSGEYIPERERCNGRRDCQDASDEQNCMDHECNIDYQFKCMNTGACPYVGDLCNGQNDCGDNSDESACPSSRCLPGKHFNCSNNRCIDYGSVCNGVDTCGDGSDEVNCLSHVCNPHYYFQCKSTGICKYIGMLCDGQDDCGDNSDETECPSPQCNPTYHFNCSDRCSTKEAVCETGHCSPPVQPDPLNGYVSMVHEAREYCAQQMGGIGSQVISKKLFHPKRPKKPKQHG